MYGVIIVMENCIHVLEVGGVEEDSRSEIVEDGGHDDGECKREFHHSNHPQNSSDVMSSNLATVLHVTRS